MDTTTTTTAPEALDTVDAPAFAHTATYSPEDNKLRIYPGHRLSAEDYARVKAAGFAWAPRQELFVAPMWTPERADICEEFAGEIGDEDKSLTERAEERADRFTDYSENRAQDADQARAGVERITSGIPLGQPILVGHHSERHARKDAERIESGMRRAVKMWETADYWKRRAAGAIRTAKYKESPGVRARRIKGIEADARKVAKQIEEGGAFAKRWATVARKIGEGYEKAHELAQYVANYDHVSRCFPLADFPRELPASQYEGIMSLWSALDGRVITAAQAVDIATTHHAANRARASRWAAHYANRLEYERAMLAEGGGLVADSVDLQPGGKVLARGEWAAVLRVNRKEGRAVSVTVTGRSWGALGVEEIKDYQPATESAAAAVKAAMTRAPLVNYPSEGCATMTAAEWAAIYKDSKGSRETKATETHGAHRRRNVQGFIARKYGAVTATQWDTVAVFISDAKRTDPPTIGGDPDKPKRKSTARKVAEAHGADTSTPAPTPDAPSIEAVAAVFENWGAATWSDADTGRTLAAAVHAGWVRRQSTTQIEWTESGVAALRAARATPTRAHIAHAGRAFRVLADFPDTDDGTAAANAYMTANDGACVVCIEGGRVYLAHRDDRGTPDAPSARLVARLLLRDECEPTPSDVAAQIETSEARRDRIAAREADAAPFAAMREALRTGQAVQVVSVPQLFPTPADVAARMVDLADIKPGDRVLEPSAGTGALVNAVREAVDGVRLVAVEVSRELVSRLAALPNGPDDLSCLDFLQLPQSYGPFDAILMNPPFADAADVRHILHARQFLAPGGRLVAICAAGSRQHAALQGLADSWEYLEPGTFAGTNVRAVLLTMGPTP